MKQNPRTILKIKVLNFLPYNLFPVCLNFEEEQIVWVFLLFTIHWVFNAVTCSQNPRLITGMTSLLLVAWKEKHQLMPTFMFIYSEGMGGGMILKILGEETTAVA